MRTGNGLLAGVLVLLCCPAVFAHIPIFSDGAAVDADHAMVIADIGLSQVVYHEVTTPGQQLWLAFDAVAGQDLYFNLGVPAIERLKDFRPAIAVVGPGLPGASTPFATPLGLGASVFATDAITTPEFFHEPFTGTDSWMLLKETAALPATGRYYVVAYVPSGQTGKLWVALGKREEFSLDDITRLPADIARVRAFHEVGGAYGFPCFLVPVAAVLSVCGLRYVVQRRAAGGLFCR